MWEKVRRIWKIKELRNSLLFLLLAVSIFRVAAHITVPGIDPAGLNAFLDSNQFLGLLNMFSGGTLEKFSIVSLGIAPYITASIIFQLLGMIFPQVEEMQKEQQGRDRLNRWTRYATAPLGLVQGFGVLSIIQQQGGQLGDGFGIEGFALFIALISMTAGTVFLMWLGELMTEKNVGNGISLLILAGIISGFPGFIQRIGATYTQSDLFNLILFLALTIVTIVTVIVINEGQRNIPVQYARGASGGVSRKVSSHLPMRVNLGGMIPIIFAISIIVFPPLIAQFFTNAKTEVIRKIAEFTIEIFANNWFYGVVYFLLVFSFTYFYATIIFRPEQVAENLQKQGGFIPGVRPGSQTQQYLGWVRNRLLLGGALFLSIIAILPVIVKGITESPNLIVGGSSVIIVVAVLIDMIKQVESQLAMRNYEIK
ncbi:MAG: Protein translocase subunit SecY [Candidatus Uhrbacteria bacterium GW2011_GWD2_41_121]|uniref:Protein translocase subunit SecY n=1 Tax=Candidatus Uhrbacteria bacterium GW2011_GWC1_41_20 TaxID=1618983 RepID=A0A0G0YG57_9BACT|nr:MAG: Protein translocase subunit SecY [Candidatus Uhrbacteria bacterium GW2011_GWE1_39_46]KKR64083.1 MAG: Protein translocase subunit SecY [Candidatus Uhrbacteria bacterium GW2011_GWC2_40_450]KKR90008.1 MAG: Protein translocase subunit SecY [Candidatus Uhrbacteria bacterium GW2011_GWD2_41_121]KKR90641.1 MAG: Protein translocase subunit SecY [Candidatus Uhrbacteria bacterium GW2011_GWE2_41_1153]KKR95918.1 MAG: Protein translocase subunit SecY [Candidatus Uhrbacteria bacterium GW2011_GWD1_41_1